jgi:hypothetical protein
MANANQFEPRNTSNTRKENFVLELFVYFARFAVQSVPRRERPGRGIVVERRPQKDEAPSGAADWEDVAPDGA